MRLWSFIPLFLCELVLFSVRVSTMLHFKLSLFNVVFYSKCFYIRSTHVWFYRKVFHYPFNVCLSCTTTLFMFIVMYFKRGSHSGAKRPRKYRFYALSATPESQYACVPTRTIRLYISIFYRFSALVIRISNHYWDCIFIK